MNTPLLVGLGFAAFSAYFLRYALRGYKTALASQHWPCVQGSLVKMHLWGKRRVDGDMQAAKNLSVKYDFEIDGKTYTGSTVAWYTLVYPQTYEFAQSHPERSRLKVYYDPDNPSKSVLIPGPHKDKPYSDVILACLGLLVGVAVAVAAWVEVIG